MVESKALEELTKLARLLEILESPTESISRAEVRVLQRYADAARVMFDTLEDMSCPGEMNKDNLEKIIQRSPKWTQGKLREHLK